MSDLILLCLARLCLPLLVTLWLLAFVAGVGR